MFGHEWLLVLYAKYSNFYLVLHIYIKIVKIDAEANIYYCVNVVFVTYYVRLPVIIYFFTCLFSSCFSLAIHILKCVQQSCMSSTLCIAIKYENLLSSLCDDDKLRQFTIISAVWHTSSVLILPYYCSLVDATRRLAPQEATLHPERVASVVVAAIIPSELQWERLEHTLPAPQPDTRCIITEKIQKGLLLN